MSRELQRSPPCVRVELEAPQRLSRSQRYPPSSPALAAGHKRHPDRWLLLAIDAQASSPSRCTWSTAKLSTLRVDRRLPLEPIEIECFQSFHSQRSNRVVAHPLPAHPQSPRTERACRWPASSGRSTNRPTRKYYRNRFAHQVRPGVQGQGMLHRPLFEVGRRWRTKKKLVCEVCKWQREVWRGSIRMWAERVERRPFGRGSRQHSYFILRIAPIADFT